MVEVLVMEAQTIAYQIIGKAIVERGDGHIQHSVRLLYRGDGTPWWTCSAGLDLAVSGTVFEQAQVGGFIDLTVAVRP